MSTYFPPNFILLDKKITEKREHPTPLFCDNYFLNDTSYPCLFAIIALLNAANSSNDSVSPRRFGSIPASAKL